jgi:hypothetical protein
MVHVTAVAATQHTGVVGVHTRFIFAIREALLTHPFGRMLFGSGSLVLANNRVRSICCHAHLHQVGVSDCGVSSCLEARLLAPCCPWQKSTARHWLREGTTNYCWKATF